MAPLYRVAAGTVACFEVVDGQVGLELEVSWHATVLQHSFTTPYEIIRRRSTLHKQPS